MSTADTPGPVEQFNPERVRKTVHLLHSEPELYALILAALENLKCRRDCIEEIVETVAVTTLKEVHRAAKQKALKTVVTNIGSENIRVFESEFLLGIAQPAQALILPQPGFGRISLQAVYGTQTARISTYLRCDCDEPSTEEDVEGDIVGEPLL